MSAVFLKILNMSITASWLILAVIFVRLLLKRAPKWMLNLRLEWLHRALEQPQKNIPRYWGFIKILPKLIREERKKVKNA